MARLNISQIRAPVSDCRSKSHFGPTTLRPSSETLTLSLFATAVSLAAKRCKTPFKITHPSLLPDPLHHVLHKIQRVSTPNNHFHHDIPVLGWVSCVNAVHHADGAGPGILVGREHGITSREARTLPKLICLEFLFYLHLRPDSVAVYLVRQ